VCGSADDACATCGSSHLVLLQRDVFLNRAALDRDASEGLVGARLLELQLQLLRAENEILGGRCLASVCILIVFCPPFRLFALPSACWSCLCLIARFACLSFASVLAMGGRVDAMTG